MTERALFFALVLAACRTNAAEPTGMSSADYGAVCAHLALVGCPEGRDPGCATILARMVAARLTNLDVACLSAASTPDAVGACGGVACPVITK